MANSTSNQDLISSSQASKEVTANALFDASSVSTLFGRRASTTTSLTWGWYGGVVVIAGTPTAISNGTTALTASQTNYIEFKRSDGTVVNNISGWSGAGYDRLYAVVCGASSVTSYTDWRFQGIGAPIATYPMQYIGTWNANINTPTLAGGTGTTGWFYKVSVAGTQDLGNGSTLYTVNDAVVYNGTTWDKVEGAMTSAEIIAALGFTPENAANKNASNGYAGLDLFKLKLRNAADTFTSLLTNAATAVRTWTMPDKDGTVAMTNDKLSAFAATTSAELAGILSDEEGTSGGFVRATGAAIAPASINGVTTDSTTNKPVTAASLNGGTLPAFFQQLNINGYRYDPSADVGIYLGNNHSGGFNEANIIWGSGGAIPSLDFGSWNGTTYTLNARLTTSEYSVVGKISASATLKSGGYTVATLPAGSAGMRAYVTDATTPTWLAALTGGGAVVCPVFYNGTAWLSA